MVKCAAERVLVIDGAMGSMIQARNLSAQDFGGERYEGCNEHLVLTRPDVIADIHSAYLEAGADIVETNTFGATDIVLAEYDLADKAYEINRQAAALARKTCERFATPERPRFVAGSMGPTTKSLLVTGGTTFDVLKNAFNQQAKGLIDGGADLLLVETTQDPLNIKAALLSIDDAFSETGKVLPVMVSMTIEAMGTMLGGANAEAMAITLEHKGLFAIGLNCSTGPDFMTSHIRTLAETFPGNVSCMPNAGLPDENGRYNEMPESFAKKTGRFIESGWVNLVGGCCGTTPEHIRMLAQAANGKKPRVIRVAARTAVSGLEALIIDDDKRPILVGERTNAIGSRIFKDTIARGQWDEAVEVARRQARMGAHVLDVCLANPERNERQDIEEFLSRLVKATKLPLMIDSTDAQVFETALRWCPGKAILNSINLEDGEERFKKVVPLIHRYGAAVVVGTIDEDPKQGMALTGQRKLAIAKRSHDLLTKTYGLKPQDLIFDVLVFPCATGDKNYYGSAKETIEGIRLVKKELPDCKTILGVSNVSFGLPPAGREILNAVFLYHCVQAGLDMAIVNTEKLARFSALPKEQIKLAEDLLFWKGPGDPAHADGFDPIAVFAAFFRDKKVEMKQDARRSLPVHERVAKNVLEGSKDGLLDDLDELLKTNTPMQIINGPLMAGMDQVGKLFAANEMIVAEVLQSAEVMKAAVAKLEPLMAKSAVTVKGKLMLATVKGDVHDIGKNLVHIILKNNGFAVIDLGIKVTPEVLIENAAKHNPDMIGLSGLLVKSAQQMTTTVEDLKVAGINVPILVGGAALSPRFTAGKIAPNYNGPVLYAKDAMHGLELANALSSPQQRQAALAKNKDLQESLRQGMSSGNAAVTSTQADTAVSAVTVLSDIPTPPDLKLHTIKDYDLEKIFGYINPIMLYGKHLGLKGGVEELFKKGDVKALEIKDQVRRLQDEILTKKYIKADTVFKFCKVASQHNKLLIAGPVDGVVSETFEFPRQPQAEHLCLSDFFRPADKGGDFACFFALTCGKGIMELAQTARQEGEYLRSYALQAIAIESAEAFAELLHEEIRRMWGFPDPATMTLKERFQAKYRGLRVSFGYPSCPNLEDQTKLFRLLEPEKHIGITLTEGFMMEPEASVSAMILHHPQARYFSV
ncbi:MAG: methionine synthase [Elusimicrobiota bacterium]